MTSFVDALKHGSMGTGQLATELCENLGLERYDAMDAWVLLILDWGLTIDNILLMP